jgi:hypothetical protein
MKIREASDLHLEFGPLDLEFLGEDVLCLSGDINIFNDGIAWARNYAQVNDVHVVYIAGNHEFYRNSKHRTHTIDSTYEELQRVSETEEKLHFLQDSSVDIDGVTFFGATLWTDFKLFGNQPIAMFSAQRGMNDYNLIYERTYPNVDEVVIPEQIGARHEASKNALLQLLLERKEVCDTELVIMTHHLPSMQSVAGRYADNPCTPAYASNLDDLVDESGAAVWFHGHCHHSMDYYIGNTRVICNPRGYARY